MKKLTVKNIGFGLVFVMGSLVAQAQNGNPIWSTSKDVQRIANRNIFNDENLRKSHINAATLGTPDFVYSKGITKISNPHEVEEKQKGNVVSKGYPMWTVSKGVPAASKKSVSK